MGHTRTRAGYKPIYQIIKDDILADIQSGRLKPHDPLESRHELIKRYGCSWATVHRAISELILEGVLYAQQGRGTFAAPRAVETIRVLSLHPIPSWRHSLVEMMEGLREASFDASIGLTVINLPHHVPDGYDLDGHVVLTPAVGDEETLQEARRRGARFIVLGSDYPSDPSLPCVTADTRAGSRVAVQRLIDAGHRRIGLVGVMDSFPNYRREIEGYEDALRAAGIPVNPEYILTRSVDEPDFDTRISRWLDDRADVTAIFAADYATSIAFMRIARMRGISIPADLSLICMDELPTAELLSVRPARVVQPFRELGRLAIERLVAAMRGAAPLEGTHMLPCAVLDGDSVSPPYAAAPSRRAAKSD